MRATLKLLPALVILALAMVLPQTAGAVVLTGGASGSPGVPPCPGCSGGAGGPVVWYDVHNTGGPQTNDIPYNKAGIDAIRDELGKGQANTGQLFNQAGQLFLAPCSGAFIQDEFDANAWLEPNSTNCPIWWNTRSSASGAAVQWNQIHSFWPTKMLDPTLDTPTAFNIKIWRENRQTNTLQLIFARQLGVNGVNSENDSAWGQDADQYWWYGGNTDNAAGVNGLGGRFTNTGETSAGPLGSETSADRQQCVNNWAAGQNGTLGIDGRPGHVVQNVRPLSAGRLDQNFCYWEGSQIGPNAFSWSKDEPQDLIQARNAKFGSANAEIKNREFGPATPNDNYGVMGAGLHEAIYLDWNIPQGGGSPYIDWHIEGAPGLFYAVQVSLVDGREQLLPFKPSRNQVNNGYLYVKHQIFSATLVDPILAGNPSPTCSAERADLKKAHTTWSDTQIDNALIAEGYSKADYPGCFSGGPGPGCTDSCCTGGCPPPQQPSDYTGAPPTVDVQLDADSPAQTREHTNQTVDINVQNYGETQAVFPFLENLTHYTPQQRFSSPAAAASSTGGQFTSYDDNYIHYDDYPSSSLVPKEPAALPPAPSGDQAPFNAQEAVLTRGLQLDRDPATGAFSNGAGPLSTQTYGMTWLQPTLLDPCGTDPASPYDVFHNGYGWPTDPQSCGTDAGGRPNTVNAWDDLLRAKAWWEERWENGILSTASDPNLIGTVYDENLRCADPVTNPNEDPNGGEAVQDCQHPSYGIFSTVSNPASQDAQGYLDVTGQAGQPGYAYISLRTNRPNRVTSFSITPRDTGQDSTSYGANAGGTLVNSVTGYVEQSFCQQGLPGPDTTHYAAGSAASKVKIWTGPGGGDKTLDDATGDPGCRGYDARWYWPQPGDSDYTSSCNSLPNKLPPVVPTGQSWPGVPVDPEGYSASTPGYAGEYNTNDTSPGHYYDYAGGLVGSPYVGRRPGGNASTGNYQTCWKLVPARYTDGSWHRIFSFYVPKGNSTTCQYHWGDVYNNSNNLRPAYQPPNNASGDGYLTACSFDWPNGSTRYRFGVYYPTSTEWVWDHSSAELGVPNNDTGKSMTPIGPGQPQRNDGKWWDAQANGNGPSNWDGISVISVNSGNHNHANEDIDKYFDDSVWVKMVSKEGYLTSGHWVLNQGPQEGWGNNNTGGELTAGGYIADFHFNWPDATTALNEQAFSSGGAGGTKFPAPGQPCPVFAFNGLTPGTCWSMQATYEGYSNRQWRFAQGSNDPWEDAAYITVYGPRDSR